MHNIRLNQITLAAKDMFPDDGQGTQATLSLHAVQVDFTPSPDTPLIYFEVDDVKAFLADKGLTPLTTPEMKPYLWFEADIKDPSGNRIRIYAAGKNRRFPPWRVGSEPTQ